MWQVQYIAFRDSDGNLVSADSVEEMGDISQELVPEGKACHTCVLKPLSLLLLELYKLQHTTSIYQ